MYSCVFALQLIDQEINPHVDQWEAEGRFPAHKIFKLLGNAGFLGVNKPVGEEKGALARSPQTRLSPQSAREAHALAHPRLWRC